MKQCAIVIDDHNAFIQVFYDMLKEHEVECLASFDQSEHALEFLGWQDVQTVYACIDCMELSECTRLKQISVEKNIEIVWLTNKKALFV